MSSVTIEFPDDLEPVLELEPPSVPSDIENNPSNSERREEKEIFVTIPEETATKIDDPQLVEKKVDSASAKEETTEEELN